MKSCQTCGKPLKATMLPGGERAWVCKKPTCSNYMKATT